MKKRSLVLALGLTVMAALAGCSSGGNNQAAATKAQTEAAKTEAAKTEAAKEEKGEAAKEEKTEAAKEAAGEFKPEKDVNFIVGFDAGGSADITARIVAKYMSKYSGVNVTVSNIVGSSGRVAANQVKSTAADGYTLLHVPVGYYLQAALGNADFTYEDFDPVTMWCDSWVGLVVRADSPYNTYEEFIEAAKANPNGIKVGSVSGTLPQLATLAIVDKEGVEFNMVDLGSNNKATELLGSRIEAYIDGVGQFKQYVESGDFRCLMAFAYEDTEIPGYEGLTSAESLGYKNFDYLLQSFGMWAPKGTDPAAIEYYANLVKQASEDPECIAELNALGYGARSDTPADYAANCKRVLEETKKAVEGILK